MFNFVQRRKWYFLFSAVLILISLVAMGISVATYAEHSPVRLSIDFLGGSLFELQFKPIPDTATNGAVTESMLRTVFDPFTGGNIGVHFRVQGQRVNHHMHFVKKAFGK